MRSTERLQPDTTIGKWLILHQLPDKKDNQGHNIHFYLCKCHCGTKREVSERALKAGRTLSCGCNKGKDENHKTIRIKVGDTFGRLTVIEKAQDRIRANGYPRYYWKCQCSCGSEVKEIEEYKLKTGHTVSCGCAKFKNIKEEELFNIQPAKKHRHYLRANNIFRRCNDPKNKSYEIYGARGIKCLLGNSIIEIAKALDEVPGYFEGAELDRIDVNSHYTLDHEKFGREVYYFYDKKIQRSCECIGNLRWVTKKENAQNRRTNISLEDLETKPRTRYSARPVMKTLGYKLDDFDKTLVMVNGERKYTYKLKIK